MKKILSRPVTFLFLICCLFVFLGPVASADEPKYGGTLRLGVRVPVFNRLDFRNLFTPAAIPAEGLIYDRLFTWGPEGFEKLIPALATGYETNDNKVWIIHLRKGVKFHNGREMTAEDIKTNFEWRITTPKGWKPVKARTLIKYLKAVEVVDRYTVKVILDKPFSSLLRVLAWAMRAIVPPEEAYKWGGKFTFQPVGTGPYKVVEVKPREKVVFERFDGYWGPKPYIERVEIKFYRSEEARLIALQTGEIDFAQLFDEARPILEKDPNLAYKSMGNPGILQKHFFNFRRWPANDLRFRKAMWMGADWKNICTNAWAFKSGNHARTLYEYSKYFNPAALEWVPPYNPEEAKKLVQAVEKDAGKKIPPIVWLDSNASFAKATGEMAMLQLAQVGINLDLNLMSHANWFDKLRRDPKLDWDTGGYGQGFARDPSLGLSFFQTNSKTAADGKSLGGYSNPEFDQFLMKAEQALNEKDRIKFFHEAERVLLEDVASIPMYPVRYVYGWNKKIKGVKFTPTCVINVANSWTRMWIE